MVATPRQLDALLGSRHGHGGIVGRVQWLVLHGNRVNGQTFGGIRRDELRQIDGVGRLPLRRQ
jgi:hypothetical protein